jgi:hypothetical protein
VPNEVLSHRTGLPYASNEVCTKKISLLSLLPTFCMHTDCTRWWNHDENRKAIFILRYELLQVSRKKKCKYDVINSSYWCTFIPCTALFRWHKSKARKQNMRQKMYSLFTLITIWYNGNYFVSRSTQFSVSFQCLSPLSVIRFTDPAFPFLM